MLEIRDFIWVLCGWFVWMWVVYYVCDIMLFICCVSVSDVVSFGDLMLNRFMSLCMLCCVVFCMMKLVGGLLGFVSFGWIFVYVGCSVLLGKFG